ncbi:MAG: hypothetical protein MJ168_10670 [Clostridia bacterium]|nr:hypothetical protein [Clostridia bacterium]
MENKNNLNKADELLESTSAEKRIKFNFNEIEAVDGPQIEDPVPAFAKSEKKPVEKKAEPVQTQPNICIIDETSTTVVIEQGPDLSANEIAPAPTAIKQSAPKEPVKFSVFQIIAMVLVGIISLWFVMFTVDHAFAVNGTYPIFSKLDAEYENGSKSFKGLGYKVQFTFDENGTLSQSCDPIWKEGPNDSRADRI